MERLTKRSDFTGLILVEGKGYGEAYFGAKEDYDRITKALHKLAAYEDAEEQGRLVVLPCKVGDKVWIVSTSFNPRIVTATVEWISAQSEQKNGFAIDLYARAEDGTGWSLTGYNIGKTVFLTRGAAEAALQKTT